MKLRYAFPIAVLAGSAFLAGAGLLGGCSGDVGTSAKTAQDADNAAPDEEAAPHDEHAGEGARAAAIVLSPEQLQRGQITLARVTPATVAEQLALYGEVVPNAENVQQVAARFPGVIRSVSRRVGDSVRRGDTLATVESNESLQTYPVTAPRAGVITARQANAGAQAGSAPLFTIADLSSVWVEITLFPRDVARVRVGQSVRVLSPEANLRGEGRVAYVAPFGEHANQTFGARVLLDNADRRWVPGLHVTAEVRLSEARVPLAVRSEAVQTLEGRSVVFVRNADGFEPKPVQLGRRDGEQVEVLSGLSAGATYAARNSFILKAELGKGEAEHAH